MKISVIIPVFNGEKYIGRILDQLGNQTYKNIEIIVVNDGSKDGTEGIIKEFADKDRRIKYLYQNNSGVSVARNNGLRNASGDYIGFIDADDGILPEFYEKMASLAVTHSADMVCVRKRHVDEAGREISQRIKSTFAKDGVYDHSQSIKEFLLGHIDDDVYTKLFRADICKKLTFDESRKINEDKFFVFEFLLQSQRMVFSNEKLYLYLHHTSSVTHQRFSRKQFDYLFFAHRINEVIQKQYPQMSEIANISTLETYLLVVALMKKDCVEKEYPKDVKRIYTYIKGKSLLHYIRYMKLNRKILFVSIKFNIPLYDILMNIMR